MRGGRDAATLRRRAERRLALAVFLVAACVSCSRESSAPPAGAVVGAAGDRSRGARPSVLLVTIDTWRADHVGVSGLNKVETPNLDRLAIEGTFVPRVQTTCPLTTPAHATILTGLLPSEHGIRDNQHFSLSAGVIPLARRFADAGYRTGAVISGAPLRRSYGLDRGFDMYDDEGLGIQGDSALTPSSRPAHDTTARAVGWLARQPADSAVFLWVHYYDPHEPYAPPSPYLDRYKASPYAGEVAYVDAELRPLLDRVRGDPGRRWAIVVTGDHGEGLGEHGEATHGILLYRSTVDVPLIVWPRHQAAPAGPVGLVDVAPTVCDLAGLPAPGGEGRSVFTLLADAAERCLFAETAYPTLGYGLNPGVLVRRGAWVYLRQGQEEIYDLAADPEEKTDLAGQERGGEFARSAAEEARRRLGPEENLGRESLSLPREDLEALRSLGYVAAPPAADRRPERKDLRRFVLDLAALRDGRRRFSARDFAGALGAYDAFLEAYPRSALTFQERGQALAALGRREEAAKSFERALALDPNDAISTLDLGNLSLARGDLTGAERLFTRSLAIEEGQPEAHLNLALLYHYKLGRPEDAEPHFRRFLELAPGDPEAAEVRKLLARP